MRRAPGLLLTFLVGAAVATVHPATRLMTSSADPPRPAQTAQPPTLKTANATPADIPFHNAEPQAEQKLLELANRARRQAGAQPLALDPGLTQAARKHAQAMADAGQLSHQFDGEASLPQRLAVASDLLLDQEAENVALDYDAQHGHEHLMLSPPHRANLLNPAYDVVGLGVLRDGDRLYIVQDFGHALPTYTVTEVKDRIAIGVNQTRREANQPELQRRDLLISDSVACSMAEADKVATPPTRKLAERFTVLTYTSLHPETLPNGAAHAVASRTLRSFSIGACYARTQTYPTGVYWVVLSLE